MTIKLYDEQPYLKQFTAVVVSCTETEKGYEAVFDRTAFFPEGGGQSSDTGTAGGAEVTDVQEINGKIVHFLDRAVDEGKEITCEINWNKRFEKMQNHSGEHIVSGIINRLFGYNNVGFHLGDSGVTIDTDGVLSDNDLIQIEKLSNQAVFENVRITAEYPDPETLGSMKYRSKLELTENVRIVTIEGYDVCACCAPHVSRTGEIGIIKITGNEKYKGGTRLHVLCGSLALEDYITKQKNISDISVMLSSKQETVSVSVKRLMDEIGEEKRKVSELRKELMLLKSSLIEETDGNICIFEDSCSVNELRSIVNQCLAKCHGICAAFSGSDKTGYQYIIASSDIDLKSRAAEINQNISGRGGGSSGMIQGSASAERKIIEKYIGDFK